MLRAPDLLAGEDLPRSPRQKRSRERRARLLDAARGVFAQKGYERASIEEIAARADAASGAVYIYFRSKRQLLLVLMQELIGKIGGLDLRPEPSGDLQSGLRDYLARVLRADRDNIAVIRAWQEASASDPVLSRKQSEILAWTESRILGVLKTLQQDPKARSGADLEMFARMMDRHFWSLLARAAALSDEEFTREAHLAADVMYHYVFVDTSE